MSGIDWRDWRTRLIANPRFRQKVARIWPFSLIARRQARRLFDISAGFVYSQTLMACVELNWFERLADGPLERTALATGSGLDGPAADRLINAAMALDLLEGRANSCVALGPLGAALIGDQGITSMAAHHHLLYQDLADPLALLRGETSATQLGDYWGYAKQDPGSLASDRVAAYSRLMAESQPMVSEQVLAAYDFGGAKRLLDVGGGTGAFVGAVGAAYPDLKLEVFDLPGVAGLQSVTGDRPVTRHAGNFCDDPLPSGADLISLVRIIHDHDDDVVDQLLTNIRQNLSVRGTLLIAEPLAGTPGAETVGDVYFGFYLLAMGSGKARTINEINELLTRNGFTEVRIHPTPVPLIASVLSANPV
ncbi:MAG: methyltransferase [Pseudomonadota bacterium]